MNEVDVEAKVVIARDQVSEIRENLPRCYHGMYDRAKVSHEIPIVGSSDGHALWTQPTEQQRDYLKVLRHLQQANNDFGEVDDLPSHWMSAVLDNHAHLTQPLPLQAALDGVDITDGVLRWLQDPDVELGVIEAKWVVKGCDEIKAAARVTDAYRGRRGGLECGNCYRPGVARRNPPRCEACDKYLRRNGRDRPAHLWAA